MPRPRVGGVALLLLAPPRAGLGELALRVGDARKDAVISAARSKTGHSGAIRHFSRSLREF